MDKNLTPGQIIGGRYQIINQIGKGGFGDTLLARDNQRPGNPECVVKQLKPIVKDYRALRKAKTLFEREAETLEKLGKHEQIPLLLAHFEEDEQFFIVQEFIEGEDITEEIPPVGEKLTEEKVRLLLIEVLEVLSYLHQKNHIHRDIKPSNIRRRKSDGKIVLIDFGAVKELTTQAIDSQGELNSTVAIGTPGYMPSEQTNYNPHFSSDIYALGMIAIQAMTSMHPTQLLRDANDGEIIWQNNVQVSQEFADIIDKMIRYDFRQRYFSAEDTLQALKSPSNRESQQQNSVKQISGIKFDKLLFDWRSIATIFVAILISLLGMIFLFRKQPELILNKEYSNYDYGIKINYSDQWIRQDVNNIITNELVKFTPPNQQESDNFQEKVFISMVKLNAPQTLEEYNTDLVNAITKDNPDIKYIQNDTTLAFKRAKEIIYTNENGIKTLKIFTLKAGSSYIITYVANKEDYDKFVDTVRNMIKSFDIQL